MASGGGSPQKDAILSVCGAKPVKNRQGTYSAPFTLSTMRTGTFAETTVVGMPLDHDHHLMTHPRRVLPVSAPRSRIKSAALEARYGSDEAPSG